MQSCTCNGWSSNFASSSCTPTNPPTSHAGVIHWILFCPHKKPIRYRISSIFLAATFGRYNLNWSGLSVNHWDLIQLTISGIIWEAGLEKCKKSENFVINFVINFDPPPPRLNEYSYSTLVLHLFQFESHKRCEVHLKCSLIRSLADWKLLSRCSFLAPFFAPRYLSRDNAFMPLVTEAVRHIRR